MSLGRCGCGSATMVGRRIGKWKRIWRIAYRMRARRRCDLGGWMAVEKFARQSMITRRRSGRMHRGALMRELKWLGSGWSLRRSEPRAGEWYETFAIKRCHELSNDVECRRHDRDCLSRNERSRGYREADAGGDGCEGGDRW